MYKCNCKGCFEISEEGNNLIKSSIAHIVSCPHCKKRVMVIGADIEYDDYGATIDNPVYIMYNRHVKPGEELVLKIIEGVPYSFEEKVS